MKARVQMKNKIKSMALLYNIEPRKSAAIGRICRNNGVIPLELDTTSAAFTVGYLCEYEGFDGAFQSCEIAQSEALILSGIQQGTADKILGEIRSSGNSVALKAFVTPSNKSWGLGKLVAELEAEKAKLG